MSSADQIQHQPDVSTQKRSDDQIDTRGEEGEELGADMATKGDHHQRDNPISAGGEQFGIISHRVPPPTPPISARWEDKTETELLNHLYAKLVNGKWGQKQENQLRHLYAQVRSQKRVDVTEEQLKQLNEKFMSMAWSSEMKELGDQLYTKITNGEWDDVIEIYDEKKQEMIQLAQITPSKKTALHIAISHSQTYVVGRLLHNIDALAIREMTDIRNENPLHLAASMGQFQTCKRLVEMDPELIGAENVEGETPLFLAVLHRKKEAFYALHPKCPITGLDIKHAKARCKRDDGNTILHASIRGEYFELAYQIILWYPELINDVNVDGQTALHFLAENPSAFRSGCYLGPVDGFIYSCFIVDMDRVESLETPSDFKVKLRSDIDFPVPGNYQFCLDLINLSKTVFNHLVSWARTCNIFSRSSDRLPLKNTSKDERQATAESSRETMSHDSHCTRSHICVEGKVILIIVVSIMMIIVASEDSSLSSKLVGDKTGPQEEFPFLRQMGSLLLGRMSLARRPQTSPRKAKEDSTERPQYPPNLSSPQKAKEDSTERPQYPPNLSSQKAEEDSTERPQYPPNRSSQKAKEDSTERPRYPPNYQVFLHFLKVALELFLFVIGIGYFRVHKIKALKHKHKLTYQIMKKLVCKAELWRYGGTGSTPYTEGGKKKSLLPSNPPDDHFTTEDQDEICQDDFASTSNNPPRPDGFKDGKKWKEMVEPIRKLTDLVEKIVSGLQGKEVFLDAEKKWSDVYRFKMPKDSVEGDDLWTDEHFSPILVAAKMGIVEMVEVVLNTFPLALYDEDLNKKNVLMLAVENGQPHVVDLLLKKHPHEHRIYQKVDNKGNTAIHLAATFGKNRPWRISSAAIQMQWDLKWYNFIKSSMPTNLWTVRNREGKTSMEVFEETHEGMIKDGVQWLNSTSESCSVVAALIASVAYASAATVPGGDNQNNGIPILKGDPLFDTFIIASLVALCLSVTSLTIFLSILTTNYTIHDFLHNLPTKLLLGLTSLFISIGAMLVSFCAGHFFNIGDRNTNRGSPVFAIICLPVSAYVLTQFHLLISLVEAPF